MWYLIADANGLASGSTLTAGQVLVIPNKVANIHNNAGTFRPYNPGEAIGDTSPTIPVAPSPPKKKKKCGGLGAILVAIVTIAVSFIAPYAAPIAAALGNIAGQVTANILGLQKGFNFASLATSVITAGITQGVLGTEALPTGLGKTLAGVFDKGGFALTAARAVVGNVINQGVGNITGSQQGFSWSSVAISGIGAAAGQFANKQLNVNNINNPVAQDLARGAVNAGANALSQVVVRGGKVNWQQVATDTILNFTSSTAQRFAANTNNVNKNAQMVAQQNRDAGVDNEPLYSTAPKGTFAQQLLDSQAVESAETYKAQLGLANTAPSAGGLSAYFPFSTEQVMPNDNAATTAKYFKNNPPEAQTKSTNREVNKFDNLNAAKSVDFNFSSVDFISNSKAGDARVQGNYWSDVSNDSVNQGGFAKYALGNTMGALEKVGYGIIDGVGAAFSSPKDGFKGARNMVVNLGPDLYNLAVNGTKTSLNGYSMLFEQSGLVGDGAFADFRNTKAYNITPLLANENQGQNGGSLLGGLALGKMVSSYGQYGVAFESINATGPFKYQAGAINIRLTGPAFATTAEATAAAEALGYSKTKSLTPNKQAIYVNYETERNLRYISRDVDGHNGGVWKAASSSKNFTADRRFGTFDANLKLIKD